MSYFEFYSKNIQDVPSSNDVNKSSGINNSARRPQNKRPTQKYYKVKKPTNMESNEKSSKNTHEMIKGMFDSTEMIKGTCLTMCPEDEVLMREKANMIHVLEVVDGKRMLVKCYSRSAADSKVAVPRLLRPYEVLWDTLQHLLYRITQSKDTGKNVVYDFVCDRLRAMRQDMTVQRLPAAQCITLLEPMIRFHVYYGYILCEYPIEIYDPVLNKKLLLECLKWFLSCCDSIDRSSTSDDLNLNSDMSRLNINNNLENKSTVGRFQKNEEFTKCDRVLMETLYILCNLDDVHPMYRYWGLSTNLKGNPSVKLAYKLAVANLRGNYVRVCKELGNLCPLTYCALCLYLPTLQRRGLQVMSVAYNSKQLTVPLSVLRRWLTLEGAAAAQVPAHYGLRTAGDALRLVRADFKADVATHQPTRQLLLDQKMDLSVKHVFTYNSKDYNYGI